MSEIATKIKCSRCNGTGVDRIKDPINNPSGICPMCSGTGYVASEFTDFTDIMDILDWMKAKIKKILKEMNLPED